MATIKHIFRGESLTVLLTFPEAYDMARIEKHEIYIGATAFAGVVSGQTIELKLTSEQTDVMYGKQEIRLWLDDSVLGVKKPYCGDIIVSNSNAKPANDSISSISDIIIPIVISETAITVGDIMYNYVIGRSAYQVWLNAGNMGTEADFFAYLQQPAADMIASLNETNEAVNEAEALRMTAETTRVGNEQGRVTAESLRATAEQTRQTNTETAIQNAANATALAVEVAEHPDTIINDYWWKWNTTTNAYENTNIMAKGGVYYPVFRLDPETGILSITADSDFTNTTFEIDKTKGTLLLKINQ